MLYVEANPELHIVNAYPDRNEDPTHQYETLRAYQQYLTHCWPDWRLIIRPTRGRPPEATGPYQPD